MRQQHYARLSRLYRDARRPLQPSDQESARRVEAILGPIKLSVGLRRDRGGPGKSSGPPCCRPLASNRLPEADLAGRTGHPTAACQRLHIPTADAILREWRRSANSRCGATRGVATTRHRALTGARDADRSSVLGPVRFDAATPSAVNEQVMFAGRGRRVR